MNVDIVFPKANEQAFLKMAKRLDYAGVCLTYNYNSKSEAIKLKQKVERLNHQFEIEVFLGLVAKP